MDAFIADLHIHSKFSRATSRTLDLENLYIWAQRKGITVVGTGDFTHPEWYSHLSEKLEPAEPGLFRLKREYTDLCDEKVPVSCRAPVRFLLSCEVSNIYKKNKRTRKNHNLVFFSDLESVHRFNTRLETIGNIHSDGRPILGLDARDLLEIVLETSDDSFLIPAHIWTPWFSMFGSKSGFDSIEECFEDLSDHIFAAETGLSSDPAMNWRVPDLDNITLVSNSDAHSPSKLGREANLFTTEMSYYAMRSALKNGDKNGFGGTFEFYPEEGKYHVDGHRKCEVCFTPAQTRSHFGKCPVCGKALTLGVLHRVEELANRPEGFQPEGAFPFFRLIPLDDLLSEILKVGSQSKKVKRTYMELLENLGSEFSILHKLRKESIQKAGVPLLAEAIDRMRKNKVSFFPGYDGLFGRVQIFTEKERERLLGQQSLFAGFDMNDCENEYFPKFKQIYKEEDQVKKETTQFVEVLKTARRLNTEQEAAVESCEHASMIVAGPGTGKTRTLTHKIAGLIKNGADAKRMLAVTFTNRAAGEMKERLSTLLGKEPIFPFVGTFHGLGYRILRNAMVPKRVAIADEKMKLSLIRDSLKLNPTDTKDSGVTIKNMKEWIVSVKQQGLDPKEKTDDFFSKDQHSCFYKCYRTYEYLLEMNHLVDFEDLIFRTVQLVEKEKSVHDEKKSRYTHIFIDEFQDINAGQYRLIQLLAANQANITIIGDPDQAIYGFRGSDVNCFSWFTKDYPEADKIYLHRNYRSTKTILQISNQVVRKNSELTATGGRRKIHSDKRGDPTILLMERPTDRSEAVSMGKTIEKMIGGTGFFSLDTGAVDGTENQKQLSFSEFAVLYRTRRQGDLILRTLEKAGIPCQLVDKKRVFENSELPSLLSVLKVLSGTGLFSDFQAAMEVVGRPVSPQSLETMKFWAYEKGMSLEQALMKAKQFPVPRLGKLRQRKLYESIGYLFELKKKMSGLAVTEILETLLQKIQQKIKSKKDPSLVRALASLLEKAATHGEDMNSFLSSVALSSDADVYDPRIEKVTLTTLHAAKGLEFSVVFIAGCEDGWIPYKTQTRSGNEEEERRLFYVGLTRAENHLFLSKANQRIINGQLMERKWSPFVKDIKNRYKRFSVLSRSKPEKPVQEQLSLF